MSAYFFQSYTATSALFFVHLMILSIAIIKQHWKTRLFFKYWTGKGREGSITT